MEEDIKVLEEYIEALRHPMPFKYTNEQKAQAIENLINRNKELEEKAYKKEYYEEVADELYKNSIPKSKVREKIKELEKEADYKSIDNPTGRIHFHKEPCDYQIQVLQELLEERN